MFILQRSLKQILCHGNEKLSMITPSMRSDSDLVLWTLKMYQTFQDQLSETRKDYYEVETLTMAYMTESLHSNEEKLKLRESVKQLKEDRPVEYLVRKDKFFNWIHKCNMRVKTLGNRFKKKY